MTKILVLNGPNLNLLGSREPEKYGRATLKELETEWLKTAKTLGLDLTCQQSNAEHELIEHIHAAKDQGIAFVIVNPGAYGHTSIALRDAFLGVAIPFIEVHISNIFARESFRHHSYLSDIAVGTICGLGTQGYTLALAACARRLGVTSSSTIH